MVGVQQCYFCFIKHRYWFRVKTTGFPGRKNSSPAILYPATKRGQRHHTGPGVARKNERAMKLTEGHLHGDVLWA